MVRYDGNLVLDNVPVIPKRIEQRMMQYQNVRNAEFQSWDPRGKGMLITTRFGDVTQLHYIAKAGGMRRQITFFDEPVFFGAFCPDTNIHGFLFTKDIGGNENYQIYFYNIDNGIYTMLTDSVSKYGDVSWANKGDRFCYSSTQRNGKDFDVYVSTVTRPENQACIVCDEGAWMPLEWSGRDEKLLIMKYISANESKLFVYNFSTASLTPVNPEKKCSYGLAVWAYDDNGIFMTSDDSCEFLSLQYYNFSKKSTSIVTGEIPWNIIDLSISHDGKLGAFVTNEHGMSTLYLLDTRSFHYEPVKNLPMGRVYGLQFSPDNKKLSLVISPSKSPADVYTLTMADMSLKRWTFSEVGGLNADSFVDPQIHFYPTFDSVNSAPRKIPVLCYKPTKAKPPFPVLINIHGGPESQFWPAFSGRLQYMINELGIAVVAPNVRGSAGYGKTFIDLDNGYNRKNAVKDIGKLLDWIERQPDFDKERIGVIGGSYGGYMALASMVDFNSHLCCGIDIYGISNFVTLLESTQEYRRDLRRVEYGDERDPAMRKYLLSISPIMHSKQITSPLFVIQGANDPRVPVSESEQMVSQIRKNKGDVWYLLAKDEGHGFNKKKNLDVTEQAIVLFLERFLLRKP